MERGFLFAEDEFYHTYNRGVEKRDIFMDVSDYERMMLLLRICNSTTPVNIREYRERMFSLESIWALDIDGPIVDIGAWCLMPNHFHLLLRERKAGGISQFMQKITTAYTMYFNKRMERVGSLMQGTFKAEPIINDRHMQYLFSYIHLNPVKLIHGEESWTRDGIRNIKQVEKHLRDYRYSSLPDYMSPKSRVQASIISPEHFPWKFESVAEMKKELTDWLSQG